MTTSSPFTQAGNFFSAVQGGVDPRTGQFSFSFLLAHLCSNNTLGPQLPLTLQYSPLTTGNPLGLGTGMTLGLTSFDDRKGKQLLQLSTGEQYKTFYTGLGDLDMRQRKLDTVHLKVLRDGSGAKRKIYVTHKTGEREILAMVGGEGVYFPVSLETPLGHTLFLAWDNQFRLISVTDGRGGEVICSLEYPVTGLVKIHLWPETSEQLSVILTQYNGYLNTITQHCSNDIFNWSLFYDESSDHHFNGNRPLTKIMSPTGLMQNVIYQGEIMRYRTSVGEGSLPAVVRHVLYPGADLPPEVHTYNYSSSNYMGYGAVVQSWDPDSDNLYNVLSDYVYWSMETFIGDVSKGVPSRLTERHYNNFHLLTFEKETVNGATLSTLRETTYLARPGVQFINQPITFQMPARQKLTWSNASSTRTEMSAFEYDVTGNLAKKIDPDGTVTTCEYYPASGSGADCPVEPNGFTRFIKTKTVMPAAGVYSDVPVIRTVWRYKSMRIRQGSTLVGAVVQADVTHFSDTIKLGSQIYDYVDEPSSDEHGRMKTLTTYVFGEDGMAYPAVQAFLFDTTKAGELRQTVTSTIDARPGHAGSGKLSQTSLRVQSSLTGRVSYETGTSGNSVSYTYDAVGRLIKQTHHPDKPAYLSVVEHAYTLPDPDKHQLALTTNTDIRGNQTRTCHDGLGRVVTEMVLDPEGKLGWHAIGTHSFDAQGRRYQSIRSDLLRKTDESHEIIRQRMSRHWDAWGLTSSETIHETGVTAYQLSDPIGRDWPEKAQFGQMMTVDTWSVADADRKVSPRSRTYYDLMHRPLISEIWAVSGDGMGWEAEPYSVVSQEWDSAHRLRLTKDAMGRCTTFKYDHAGRGIETTYADGSTVKKTFSPFSLSAMVTQISLADPEGKETVLGHQVFDGLGRLISTTSGGRTTTMTYDADWQQHPSVVKGPDGVELNTKTDPALGEAPVGIMATGNAVDVNQSFSYELTTGLMVQAIEKDTYSHFETWKSGLLKTEITKIAGGASHRAGWLYSLGGLPQVYTGVEEASEIREWSSIGRLISITDPAVKITLHYDSLNRLTSWVANEKDGASLITTLVFDALWRESGRSIAYKDKKTQSIQSINQLWTVGHQLSQRTLIRDDKVVRVETFSYDIRNRLVDYQCGGSDLPSDPYGNTFTRQQFIFDALGNIITCKTTLSEGGVTNTGTYLFDNSEDPCQLTGVKHSLKDKRYHYPEKIDLEYDKAGRMTKDDAGRTLRYDAMGRLYEVKEGGTYGYDARDRMVYQKVDSTKESHRLYYRANRLIGEWTTKGDGKTPHPEDSQVRLIYAAGSCAAQAEMENGVTRALLTGTDGKKSVVVTGEDGVVKNTTYAPYGYTPLSEGMGVTDDPASVVSSLAFELEFSDSTVTRNAVIFSNGLNQVAVTVRTILIDKLTSVVHLTPSQLWSALTLKTTRGEEIKKQPADANYQHLSVWNGSGNFSHAVRYGPTVALTKSGTKDDDYSAVTVYLSTAEQSSMYEIYAEFNFPHFSETTEGGTGQFLSHLNINTIPKINYSETQNWRLDLTSGWNKKSTPKIESQQKAAPYGWTDGGTVDSRYRKVYVINTNQAADNPIRIWARQLTGKTFESIGNSAGSFNFGNISTDFGWGYNDGNYDIITWWVEPAARQATLPDVGYQDRENNYCFLQAFNHWYRIDLNGEGVHQRVDSVREDAITLYQWNIRYANSGIYQWGWSDVANDATVAVTDNFGNQGVFHIHFPVDGWDPQLTFGQPIASRIPDNTKLEALRRQAEKLSPGDREAFLHNAGVYHLGVGTMQEEVDEPDFIRTVRRKFDSEAIPSEADFDALIAICLAAPGVLPQGTESADGLKLFAETLSLSVGPGFSLLNGRLTFDVAAYLKRRHTN